MPPKERNVAIMGYRSVGKKSKGIELEICQKKKKSNLSKKKKYIKKKLNIFILIRSLCHRPLFD